MGGIKLKKQEKKLKRRLDGFESVMGSRNSDPNARASMHKPGSRKK